MQHYTYKVEGDELYSNSLYKKRSPKDAATCIFRRLLRDCKHMEAVKCIIIVKNLDNGKQFIYDCRACYNPYQKLVAKNKVITIYFDINILKLNSKCLD